MFFNEATTLIKIPNNRGEYNAQGELKLDSLANEITITNGELLIDTNVNKSGWECLLPKISQHLLFNLDRTIATFVEISQLNFAGGISAVIPSSLSGKIKLPFFDRSDKISLIFSKYSSKIFILNFHIS